MHRKLTIDSLLLQRWVHGCGFLELSSLQSSNGSLESRLVQALCAQAIREAKLFHLLYLPKLESLIQDVMDIFLTLIDAVWAFRLVRGFVDRCSFGHSADRIIYAEKVIFYIYKVKKR